MWAFEDNATILDQGHLNTSLSQQNFALIYEGTQFDSATAAGTTENSLADYYYVSYVTSTGATTLSRVELELKRYGSGQDLTLHVLDTTFTAAGRYEAGVLTTVTVPKEFIKTAVGTYLSIALNTTLTGAATYYIKADKAGDATNYLALVGLATIDSTCLRRAGTTGVWSWNNTLHMKAFHLNTGNVIHCIEGTNKYETYLYTGTITADISSIYRYLPASSSTTAGVRDIMALTWDGDYLTAGTVT